MAAVKRDLPGIKTPTLIVHAGNDDIASARSNALYVRDHIGGPTELLLLDRSYHMVTIDQERNVVGDATARFAWNLLSDAERERLAAVARELSPPRGDLCANAGRRRRAISRFLGCGRDGKSGGRGGAMTALIVFLWIANMLVDTGGQLFFKGGGQRAYRRGGRPRALEAHGFPALAVVRHLLLRARVFRVDGVPFAG